MSEDPDRIVSLGKSEPIEYIVKASRFIGQTFPVDDEGQLRDALAATQTAFPSASHYCWGARFWIDERSDDAGEPRGTAGKPILQQLQRADVSGVACIVTRYFGGTKLGTGGLIRAYGGTALRAVSQAPARIFWQQVDRVVEFDFADMGAIEATLKKSGDAILEVVRDLEREQPRLTVAIKQSRAGAFGEAIRDATSGRARVE